MYTFKAYVNHMDIKKSLGRELEKCIEPSVDKWFERLKATVMPKRGVSIYIVLYACTRFNSHAEVLLDFSTTRKN